MPFNISNPVLFYNKKTFQQAGLDPGQAAGLARRPARRQPEDRLVGRREVRPRPRLRRRLRRRLVHRAVVRQGRQFYADNQNGRQARATKVLYNNDTGVQLLTFMQSMVTDGLAVNVGDNTDGFDDLLKLADPQQPAAMTIDTSASLVERAHRAQGGVSSRRFTPDDLGIGPMPGPDGEAACSSAARRCGS